MTKAKQNVKSPNRLFPSSNACMTEELRESYFEELFAQDTILTNRLKPVSKKNKEKKSKWEQGLTNGKVTRTYEKEASELYRLVFINTSNYEIFEVQVTPEHPFYVISPVGKDGKGRYIAVKNLEIGYRCISIAGCGMQLIEKEYMKLDQPVKVYNLEVEGSHNYFVGSSKETSILVHNKCGSEQVGKYTQLFIDLLANAKRKRDACIRRLLAVKSTSTVGVISDRSLIQDIYDDSSVLRALIRNVGTLEHLDEMALNLSTEQKEYFFQTVFTLFNTRAFMTQVYYIGNCQNWTVNALENCNALSLPSPRGFGFAQLELEVDHNHPDRPYSARNSTHHCVIQIQMSDNMDQKIYFDNSYLGMPLTVGVVNSYGGCFLEVPPWLKE